MTQLKHLPLDKVPAALRKAAKALLHDEPDQAESICEDILLTDPNNQTALRLLIIVLTDRFCQEEKAGFTLARKLIPRLYEERDRAYFSGLINDRQGNALVDSLYPESREDAFECLREAMECYERAAELSGECDSDAFFRWNACARTIERCHLTPRQNDHCDCVVE